MDISVASLADLGAFAGAPVRKPVTWTHNGEKVTGDVYVRPASYYSVIGEMGESLSREQVVAARIANHICDKQGQPLFTVADVLGNPDTGRGPLNSELTVSLLNAIGEVLGLGKQKPARKTSPRKKSSGASSSSRASEAARSRKPSTG